MNIVAHDIGGQDIWGYSDEKAKLQRKEMRWKQWGLLANISHLLMGQEKKDSVRSVGNDEG